MATSGAAGPSQPYNDGPWIRRARQADEWLAQRRVVFSATTASIVSTFAGFPLDSLKSRLQSSRENLSLPRLAAEVVKEEGIGGLWRGFPLPLITISIVRTISFTIYTSTKRIINSRPGGPEPEKKPWLDIRLGLLNRDSASNVALTSFLAGAASGAVVCIGSAPFELVKVRRQLEYQIYRDSHPEMFRPEPGKAAAAAKATATTAATTAATAAGAGTGTAGAVGRAVASAVTGTTRAQPTKVQPSFMPPTTLQAVRLIVNQSGVLGLWTGFRLHFVRDTLGTALYFAEYDTMRYALGRKRSDPQALSGSEDRLGGAGQGQLPDWARWLPVQLVPFLCGSLAGVTSWALIYPVDAIKTKAQQRALSGLPPRTPFTQFMRLVRGTDATPKPLLTGVTRLYRGLGVSMIRSMLTHGLLWTLIDSTSAWIDTRPVERLASGRKDLPPLDSGGSGGRLV